MKKNIIIIILIIIVIGLGGYIYKISDKTLEISPEVENDITMLSNNSSNFSIIPLQWEGKDVSVWYYENKGMVNTYGWTSLYSYAKLLIIDYDTRTIGLASIKASEEIKDLKYYTLDSFTDVFSNIVITEKDIKKYTWLPLWKLYYQPIKEADFDSFMIVDWSRWNYAIDKNHVYAIKEYLYTTTDTNETLLKYYSLFPHANRKSFYLFDGLWVQNDGVYAGSEKRDIVMDPPLTFIKNNINVIPSQNF